MFGEISLDGGLQIGDRAEDTAANALSGHLGEEILSTALSQEAEVGAKWKVQRGWRASQASTLGCLWVA